MPSKSRKHSKTPVTPSYSNQSTASKSLVPSTPHSESEISEEHIVSILEEASIRFPSLISKDALIGRIVDVESKSGSHAANIWLSESAMVASRLTAGSIVSVSLASSKSNLFSSFPLDLLVDESSAGYGFEVSDKRSSEVGNYFALAVVYPSCKVLKDGVRLSQSLLSTMGNPLPGKIIFISPIGTHSIPSNGIDKLRHPSNKSDSCLSTFNCRDLYLELYPSSNVIGINSDMLCSNGSTSTEAHHDNLQNGNVSSPKTPLLYKSNISSPDVTHVRKCESSGFSERHAVGTLSNTYDIVEALGNEKSRGLLQTCASLCLRGRLLLCGNLVVFKMFGQVLKFVVNGANTLSTECPSEDISSETKYVTCRQDDKTHEVDCMNIAYIIDCNTRLHLSSSLLPEESNLPAMEPECAQSMDKKADHTIKLGGLSKEYAILKEVIMSSSAGGPLSSLGLRSIKGVLLHGPPGTGKTCLARSCVNDTGFKLFSINGPEIISQFLGESEQALCDVFDSASQAAPAVTWISKESILDAFIRVEDFRSWRSEVFIDELDAIAPARKDGGDELSQRMVATLLNLMDGIGRTDGVIVIAATNRPDSIDPALRRPGRLDREIEIGVPSPKQRFDILQTLLEEIDHSLVNSQVQHLASSTHGFVGADLAALCNEAALACLRRHIKLKSSRGTPVVAVESDQCKKPCIDCDNCSEDIMGGSALSTNHVASVLSHSDSTLSSETVQSFDFNSERREGVDRFHNENHYQNEEVTSESGQESLLKVCVSDFEKAKMKVRPSAMREVILEIPKVSWEDVGGQEEVKKQLIEAVEWPQKHQDSFKRIGTRPPTGVLLFGPPGCSKTLMARAVASEAGLNFLSVKGPELFSKWVGESEKAVKSLFAKARVNAPSIIFFDEIDGLAIIRGKENDGVSVSDRVMSQLLVELDGLHQRVDVTVIAATNRPDKIDPALLRPGRFDRVLYVGPPNEDDRVDIFRIHLRKMPCSSDVVTRDLARLTVGCTGADISLICREAALAAIEESIVAAEISMAHFMIGLRRVQPSEVRSYQEFSTKFQRNVCSGSRRDEVGH